MAKFVVTKNPQFTHKVKVQVPVNGGFETQDFDATFNVVPTDEIGEYDLSSGPGSTDFLRRAVDSLSDLVDEKDQPVSWNDSVRDLLFGQLYVRKALVRAYFEAVSGAQSGN
ncbi:hypothetical protein ACFOKF_15335 [Sphingobium rhizovicinum]|uniref:Uncharacterized protein n=1 Tax=Sphingobium rhizovicinum TaxID=432308 RepID=A0ABV7NJP5_9SPHN